MLAFTRIAKIPANIMTLFLRLFLFQERSILLFPYAILPSYFLYVSLASKA